jgi:hypothetical protein
VGILSTRLLAGYRFKNWNIYQELMPIKNPEQKISGFTFLFYSAHL